MVFDLRPGMALDPAEAQLNEPGLNKWNNCGPAAVAIVMRALGYGDPFEPQQITDAAYGPNYVGGEDIRLVWQFVLNHRTQYPNPPAVSYDAGDVLWLAAQAGSKGFPMVGLWHCNTNGDIEIFYTGHFHYSPIVFDTGAALGIWNVMRGQQITLPYSQARAAYAGGFTTFHRSVLGSTTAMAGSEVRVPQEDTLALRLVD